MHIEAIDAVHHPKLAIALGIFTKGRLFLVNPLAQIAPLNKLEKQRWNFPLEGPRCNCGVQRLTTNKALVATHCFYYSLANVHKHPLA